RPGPARRKFRLPDAQRRRVVTTAVGLHRDNRKRPVRQRRGAESARPAPLPPLVSQIAFSWEDRIMLRRTLLRWLYGRSRNAARTVPLRSHRSFVPRLDVLEDRTVLSTLTVLNNLDNGPGSLRQAILDADSNPGLDTICFRIGTGAQTIHVGSGGF